MHPTMTPLHMQTGAVSDMAVGRLVRLQRSYRCPECEAEHHSWARLSSCPDCGHPLSVAVITRAALAGTP
jgi:peptide subunit release factor 1 (eRF1)